MLAISSNALCACLTASTDANAARKGTCRRLLVKNVALEWPKINWRVLAAVTELMRQ